MVIIFYNTGLYKSASSTYYFGKLIFRLFVSCLFWAFTTISHFRRINNIYKIIVYISATVPCLILQHKNRIIKNQFWHILLKKHSYKQILSFCKNLELCYYFLKFKFVMEITYEIWTSFKALSSKKATTWWFRKSQIKDEKWKMMCCSNYLE